MINLDISHFHILDKIWKYLLFTLDLGLFYDCSGDNFILKGYCNVDWGNDLEYRKSISVYIYSLFANITINNFISWVSQLQKTIAISLCEAEYMALRNAMKEVIYLKGVFNYMNNVLKLNYISFILTILVDSLLAKRIAENLEFYKRVKYIEMVYYFTRQAANDDQIRLVYIPTKY